MILPEIGGRIQQIEKCNCEPGMKVALNGNVEHRLSASVSRRDDSFAFLHGKDAVDGGDRNFFLRPAWPVNFHPVHFHCHSKAEVQALIGTRCIASTAEDVPALPTLPVVTNTLAPIASRGLLGPPSSFSVIQ